MILLCNLDEEEDFSPLILRFSHYVMWKRGCERIKRGLIFVCYAYFCVDILSRAAAVLGQAEPAVAELLGGRDLVLPFSGIRHFRKDVVFLGLADGQHRRTLDRLAGQQLLHT